MKRFLLNIAFFFVFLKVAKQIQDLNGDGTAELWEHVLVVFLFSLAFLGYSSLIDRVLGKKRLAPQEKD